MPAPETYDLVVIGSGEGGKFLAWHMAHAGRRVAVIERKLIGGSCPNTNCLPSKNEIWSAKVAHLARHGTQFGVVADPIRLDMRKVVGRKREMVRGLIDMHLDFYHANGAELIMGTARFVAPRTIEVRLNEGGTRLMTAEDVVINVGSRASIPDIPGLADAAPLTNVELLELDRLPDHLIVLGGGYVGLELAQAYRRFGSAVTLIDVNPQLLIREDPEVGAEILALMREEGMTVHLDATVLSVRGRSGDRVRVQARTPTGDLTIDGTDILVAVGRTPNTQGMSVGLAGVELTQAGYVRVNDRLQTTAPNTWAIGDCAGSPQFTHASFDDFRIVRDNMSGGDRTTRDRLVPYCMFTDPALARVGLNETEAKARGIAVRVATLPNRFIMRAHTLSEMRGFMKVLVAADSDRILGFAMVGAEAGEVVSTVQTAMLAGLPYTGLRDAILTHPTMTEGLIALMGKVPPG